jgi:erythritol transport system substrate-binding protein
MSRKATVLTLAALALAAPDLALSATAASAADGGLVSVIVIDPANPYWLTEGNVAAAEAKKLGYTATVGASKGDTNTESKLIDTAITNKSVAIILDPADASGSIGAVKRAIAANIPVFLVNAEINQEGLAKAQLVSNNAATRSNGYDTVLSQYDGLKKVGSQVANWDRTQGHDKMQNLLQAHPDIIGVISGNDEMALGAVAALKEAGKLSSIKVGGFDGSPDAVAAIKSGELQYTVLQPVAVYSKKAVDEADSFLKTGKTGAAGEKQLFDCALITGDNIADYIAPFTLK